MYNPLSTYRLQLNDSFPLAAVEKLWPYLRDLGIKTIYAAPIFEATPGSTHGYDGVDPARIAPEIGTTEQLEALARQLNDADMGWLQDIVPNHMAFHQHNTWLVDLLEKGPLSRYKDFFDLTYTSNMYQGRLMAPFLGESLEKTLEQGALRVVYDRDRLMLQCFDNQFPLKPGSYATALGPEAQTDAQHQWLALLEQLHAIDEPETLAIAWDECLTQLAALAKTDSGRTWIDTRLQAVNNQPETLAALVHEQHYELCAWTEAMRRINYRRFFTVNGLICLNMQNKDVFDQYHDLIAKLVKKGLFQGVRVDHVDGLYDPDTYLNRLRELVGAEAYVVVEKIQQADEPMPAQWPIQGSSGYDFLAQVNNLLTDPTGEAPLTEFFESLVGTHTPMDKRIRDRKAYILYVHMGGELNNLLDHFHDLNLAEPDAGVTDATLRLAIGELLIHCPVYRYYGNQLPLEPAEATALRQLFTAIRTEKPDLKSAVDLLEEVLLTKPPVADADYRDRARRFYSRVMQFTGPLMAKGVEDTLMYTYNRFIGHNEVGDSPGRFGLSVTDFHQTMQERQQHLPLSMNGLSTHDTKRGEDARARLNVLTSLPHEWLAEVQEWQTLNADLKTDNAPDSNDEYLLYQSLLASYPMPTGTGEAIAVARVTADGDDPDTIAERFDSFLQKALHEAKRHVSEQHKPGDDAYIEATRAFARGLLDPSRPFWNRFESFLIRIADAGITHSLAQVALKNTCPGIPDLYQGAEGWDLSFVDPDNRRPVDFDQRRAWLAQANKDTTNPTALWRERWSGEVKFYLTYKLLQARRQNPDLFGYGAYIPLTVNGPLREYALAFARQHEDRWLVVVVPLYTARLCREQGITDPTQLDWQGTRVLLPDGAPNYWTSVLTGATVSELDLNTLLGQWPVAILQ